MKKKLTFLGIETSCDETAASVVREKSDGTGEILSNVVSSQIEEHKAFGGIVPEVAARAHVEKIDFIINKALKDSKININDECFNIKATLRIMKNAMFNGVFTSLNTN